MDVHVDVDHLEVGGAGQQEELDHLRRVSAGLLLLLHVAVLAVLVVEGEMELAQGSEVLTAGFQDGTVLYLEADDPEEAELDTVVGDTEEMAGLDVADLKEEKTEVSDVAMVLQDLSQTRPGVVGELELQVDEVGDDGEAAHLGIAQHHLDDGDVGEGLGDLGQSDGPREPLGGVGLGDVGVVHVVHVRQ